MINKIDIVTFFFILVLPITLITGSFIPDLTISVIGIIFLYFFLFNKRFEEIYNYNFFYISIFFWLYILFISLFSENKILAYKDAIIFIRILLIPIFIYFWILNDESKIKKITLVTLIAVLFVCLDTLYQFSNYDPEIGFGKDIFGFKPSFYGRLTGPFYNELIPGAFISKFSFIGLVAIFLFIKNKNFKITYIIMYLTLVGTVCYISGERMALATFILGLVLLFLFLKKIRLILFISLIIMLTSCFIINKTHPIYNDYSIIESTPYHLGLKVEKIYTCKNDSKTKCKKIIELQPSFMTVLKNFHKSPYGEIYLLSIKMWKDHYMQGIGLNNFTFLCNNDDRYRNLIKNYSCVSHPHNFYLQWLVETGILGLLFFIAYLIIIFKFIYEKQKSDFSIIGLTTMIILFWPIISTGSLLKNWNGVCIFFIIGICLSLTKIKQKI